MLSTAKKSGASDLSSRLFRAPFKLQLGRDCFKLLCCCPAPAPGLGFIGYLLITLTIVGVINRLNLECSTPQMALGEQVSLIIYFPVR
jgi:hypothetical protein